MPRSYVSDKKCVCQFQFPKVLSTEPERTFDLIPTVTWNGKQKLKTCFIADYFATKKSVDIRNQLSSFYSPLRTSKKLNRGLKIEFLVSTCFMNVFVKNNRLFFDKQLTPKNYDLIILSLIGFSPVEELRCGKFAREFLGNRLSIHFLK